MTTQAQSIDVPASRALIAAVLLIVGLCLLALTGQFLSRAGSTQGSSTDVTATQPFPAFVD